MSPLSWRTSCWTESWPDMSRLWHPWGWFVSAANCCFVFQEAVSMVLNGSKQDINLVLHFRINDFDYKVHVITVLWMWSGGSPDPFMPWQTRGSRGVSGKAGHSAKFRLHWGELDRKSATRVVESVLDVGEKEEDTIMDEDVLKLSVKRTFTQTRTCRSKMSLWHCSQVDTQESDMLQLWPTSRLRS